MRDVLAPYPRLGVPDVHHDLTTSRLLVLGYVEGVGIRRSEDSPERREAAKQLLEAFYRQILVDGFFHADPHPGNLLWTGEKIVLLDLGMVGELDAHVRELMIVLLLAFARNDPKFMSEAVLMLAGEEHRGDLDLDGLERDFTDFVARFQVGSLRDIQIGPMLDGMIKIASRHGVRLPSSLALSGKAFGQVQLAITELDPTLDPFRVVGDFLLRNVRDRLIRQADPQRLYYEGQKARLRLVRLVEAVERATGARPGPKLQVDFIGAAGIEKAIARAGVRMSVAAAVGAAFGAWLALDRARRL
jgi:predicted unusual protein kinase regulating ubiquinone biosynthesis (AarF/ABC1/UbiB family)